VPLSTHFRLYLVNSSYERIAKWETYQIFQRRQIVGACSAVASVTKMATVSGVPRAPVSKVLTAYTDHGKTSLTKGNSGQKPKLSERNHHSFKRIV